MYNLLNIAAGTITAISIFRLTGKLLNNNRYAFLCAITFSLSSFSVYLHSTGMKESVFIMFIALFFEHAYIYWNTKRLLNLITASIFLVVLLLFRPAVFSMALVSLFIGQLLSKKQDKYTFVLIIFIIFGFIAFYDYFNSLLNRLQYLTNKDVVELKAAIKPTIFNYFSAFLSSLIGPLPSYPPMVGREQQAFYSLGLGFRVFLFLLYIKGLYAGFKAKEPFVIAMGVYTISEILILATILESFELRLNSPHLVQVYIIAFYGLYQIKNIELARKQTYIYLALSSIIILVWNLRF
jgi:hypothetical protein